METFHVGWPSRETGTELESYQWRYLQVLQNRHTTTAIKPSVFLCTIQKREAPGEMSCIRMWFVFSAVLITGKHVCLLLGKCSSQITGATISFSKERNVENPSFFKHVLGNFQFCTQIYYLVCSTEYIIKLYSIIYYVFGLYIDKVNVRRENEIVAGFSSLLSLFLICCGHLRARNSVFQRACVIWDSWQWFGSQREENPKPWVLLFSFLETSKCYWFSLIYWFSVWFPSLGVSIEFFP